MLEQGVDSVHVDGALRTLNAALRDMDAALTQGGWLAVDRYGLADIAVTAYFDRLEPDRATAWRSRPCAGGFRGRVPARRYGGLVGNR